MILDKLVEDIKNNNETVFTVVELTDDGFKQIDLTPAPPARYCYSISKAFTATAVGMLYSQGVWTENDLIYPIIEDIFPENHDKKWEKVTLANVLNHRSGFGRGMLSVDSDDFYEYDINKDFLYPMLSMELPYEPGHEMIYTDCHYYLLSRLVERKVGMTLYDYLQENLFVPLRFQSHAWSTCPQGHTMGGSGFFARPVDLAKLGWIYLNGGVYEGRRYLSEDWIKKATNTLNVDEHGDYGFAVQRKTGSNGDYYFSGAFGQLINIMPRTHRVIAFQSFSSNILRIIDNLRIWEDEELAQK